MTKKYYLDLYCEIKKQLYRDKRSLFFNEKKESEEEKNYIKMLKEEYEELKENNEEDEELEGDGGYELNEIEKNAISFEELPEDEICFKLDYFYTFENELVERLDKERKEKKK